MALESLLTEGQAGACDEEFIIIFSSVRAHAYSGRQHHLTPPQLYNVSNPSRLLHCFDALNAKNRKTARLRL